MTERLRISGRLRLVASPTPRLRTHSATATAASSCRSMTRCVIASMKRVFDAEKIHPWGQSAIYFVEAVIDPPALTLETSALGTWLGGVETIIFSAAAGLRVLVFLKRRSGSSFESSHRLPCCAEHVSASISSTPLKMETAPHTLNHGPLSLMLQVLVHYFIHCRALCSTTSPSRPLAAPLPTAISPATPLRTS